MHLDSATDKWRVICGSFGRRRSNTTRIRTVNFTKKVKHLLLFAVQLKVHIPPNILYCLLQYRTIKCVQLLLQVVLLILFFPLLLSSSVASQANNSSLFCCKRLEAETLIVLDGAFYFLWQFVFLFSQWVSRKHPQAWVSPCFTAESVKGKNRTQECKVWDCVPC